MLPNATDAAIDALIAARRSGTRIEALPPGSRPEDLATAHAMQDAMIARLGERVAGWKVGIGKDGAVMRGAILGSRMLESPARIPARDVPLLGIEGEIAFGFERDMPSRRAEYDANEVAGAVTALVGIEIVASRFRDYAKTPLLDRTVDCMSNGAYIAGTRRTDWRNYDLSSLRAILRVNGSVVVDKVAGHPAGDPLGPAVALLNALRHTIGIAKGQIVTTGTFTGLHFAAPGDAIAVAFPGFGAAEVVLDR